MSEPKIGRVLAASLHQAINEVMPTRFEFYESWLTAGRIRQGELGRARVNAVVSFLRQEGAAYDAVMQCAGRYTAAWTLDAKPAVERALVRWLPRPIRVRVVLRIAARLIRGLHGDIRLRRTVRRGTVLVSIEGSLFCDVRAPTGAPLCRFYGAVIEGCLESFGIPSRTQLSRCRGTGDVICQLVIETRKPGADWGPDPPSSG